MLIITCGIGRTACYQLVTAGMEKREMFGGIIAGPVKTLVTSHIKITQLQVMAYNLIKLAIFILLRETSSLYGVFFGKLLHHIAKLPYHCASC